MLLRISGVLEDALDHVGRHFLHDVHRIVQIQLVEHFLQLGVGKALDQQLLLVGVQLHEHLRRQLLGQQTEQQRQVRLRQVAHQQGDVRRLDGDKEGPQRGVLFSADEILYFFDQFRALILKFQHTRSLLSPI